MVFALSILWSRYMLKLVASNELWKDDAAAKYYSIEKIQNMVNGLRQLRDQVDSCVIISTTDDEEVFKSDIIILANKLEGFISGADGVIVPNTILDEIEDLLDWGQELIGDSVETEIT
jgi:hypothetical protein